MTVVSQRVSQQIARTTGPISPADLARLHAHGWVLLEGIEDRDGCERVLRALGDLRPQYGGVLRHEVRFRPGFDDIQYSQSANPITPHTEAPGQDPPPRYLALHCRRQARCGGGATVLADGHELVRSLPQELRGQVGVRMIRFDLATKGARAAPVVSPDPDGTPILRFSYNVMRDGRLEGPARRSDDLDGVDPFLAELCRRGVEFTRRFGSRVIAPDHSLLVFDNWRMLHAREGFEDRERHLTRYWLG